MIPVFNPNQKITGPDGKPTLEHQQFMAALLRELSASQDKLAAIAAVTAPTGGATVDSQARTAINAILAAAT